MSILFAVVISGAAEGNDDYFRRPPYLQLLSATSVTIVSQSVKEVRARLMYGATPALADGSVEGPASHDHVFGLEGLAPDTVYYYEVEHRDVETFPVLSFRTLPEPGTELRVAALGDSGMVGSSGQGPIARVLRDLGVPLLLHMGDLVTPWSTPRYIQDLFFAAYEDCLASTCVYPVLGNHEAFAADYWLDAFHTPANNPSSDENYYSFDAGDAHFVALNSCANPATWSAQLRWLDGDLEGTSRSWKIAYFHHPPYAIGLHGGDRAVRAEFCPVFERHAVDLVLSGNEHLYERTYPLSGGWTRDGCQDPAYVAPRGTIYAITGGGGATLYNCTPGPDSPVIARCVRTYNVLLVTIKPDMLTVRAIDAAGQKIDEFEIRKRGERPPLSLVRGDANGDGAIDLGDGVAILNYLFRTARTACLAASDVNASGEISIADAVYLFVHLFAKGKPPPPPFPEPGDAVGADDRGCTCPAPRQAE